MAKLPVLKSIYQCNIKIKKNSAQIGKKFAGKNLANNKLQNTYTK